MKSVWPVFYSFDPEMVLHFHFTFKPFPGHAQKRESKRKKRAQPPKLTPIQLTLGHAKLTSPPILQGSPITEPNADPQSRSTVPIVIARSTAPTAILPSRRSRSREAPRRSQPLVEPNCLSLFLLLSIWPDLMIFFSGFCLCFCIEEWMILYIRLATKKMWENVTRFDDFFFGFCLCFCIEEWMVLYIRLATEKMWPTSRKCVFYGVFNNTTKHQKIFFETFFKMQPNTWKHFPFRKIAFPENEIFSKNAFTRTKWSLNCKFFFFFFFVT